MRTLLSLVVLGTLGLPTASLAAGQVSPAAASQADPSGAAAALPAVPLRTCGRWIVDTNGKRFKLASVNWYGASDAKFVVGGLDKAPVAQIAHLIRTMGFNSVRLPFSNEMVESNPTVDSASVAANPQLKGKTALEVFDAVIEALANEGIVVILNNHIGHAQWCCCNTQEGLWHTADYPETKWIEDWTTLVQRYINQPAVVGVDLRNEPRATTSLGPAGDQATWGGPDKTGIFSKNPTDTDWRKAAIRGANAVLAVNPNLLIVVEGVNYAGDLSGAYSNPIKDDPMGIDTFPLDLTVPNRLVYSPHNYPWLWDMRGGSYANMDYPTLKKSAGLNWGYLITQWQPFTAPVWVGEFGAAPDDLKQNWLAYLMIYLQEGDFDWGYWALNVGPKAGTVAGHKQPCTDSAFGDDNYGLLSDDWSKPLTDRRIAMLKSIQPATQGPGVGANDSCPAYGTASATGPDQDRSNGLDKDWDAYAWKATCAKTERVVGLSLGGPSTSRYTRKALCRTATWSAKVGETVTSDGAKDTPHAKEHSHGNDWAPGFIKLECALGEYVAGVSQTQKTQQYAFHGLLCRRASTPLGTQCNTRSLDQDDRGSSQPSDWDSGAIKGQCADDQYVAGVGVMHYPTQDVPRSLLCCK